MLLAVLALVASVPPWKTTLFHADTGNGYKAVRVPNIVAFNNGTLLAIVQAKLQGTGDDGATQIMKRRSDDDGATWTQSEVVLSDAKSPSEFDAVAIVDPSTDTAFLVSSISPSCIA
jgi:sialidase-1